MAIVNGYENGLTLDREKNRTNFNGVNPHVLAFNVLGGVKEHHTMNASTQKLKVKSGKTSQAAQAAHSTSGTSHGGTVTTRTKQTFF